MRSLYVRWMSDVARKVWMRGFAAVSIARQQRSMSSRLARASAQMTGPSVVPISPAIACTASQVAARGRGEARLDDVHAESRELPRDRELLVARHCAAGRLLAIAQRRIEHPNHSLHGYAPPCPGTCSRGSTNGILRRSSRPTFSIGCSVSFLRNFANSGRPLRFSSIQRFAKLPSAHLLEQLAHGRPRCIRHQARSRHIIPVLGRVGHRVTHVVQAALVEKIDDQLELVHALEVRELGLIAGVDERLEARLHERRHAAAQNRLLAEQIGLGFLGERREQHARARAADPLRVRERIGERVSRRVSVHRDERGHATAMLEHLAHAMPGRLGRDHAHVHARRRDDLAVADVEAVSEQQRLPGGEMRRDVLARRSPSATCRR